MTPEKTIRKEYLTSASELFIKVRDVPYILGVEGKTETLLEDNFGGCTRKHLFLLPRLKQMGYEVKIGIAQFDWRELPIPKDILNLLKQPVQYHMFLFLNKKTKSFMADATWDKEMNKFGFPLTEWDESNQLNLGIKPISVDKQNLFLLQSRSFVSESIKTLNNILRVKHNTPFNDAFNNWLGRGK